MRSIRAISSLLNDSCGINIIASSLVWINVCIKDELPMFLSEREHMLIAVLHDHIVFD